MADRHWYDSFPGVEVNEVHPVLDPYGTPYGGPEHVQWPHAWTYALDSDADLKHAPYTTVSQNRGGIA